MPRALLILPSQTYRAPDFLEAARTLGIELVVASDRRQAMARAIGDRAVTLPLDDPPRAAERIAALAERTPLDAVVAADDGGVRTAALAAERLGLARGNPPEAAARTRDKAAMRAALAAAGVPQPGFRLASGPHADVAALAAELGPPVVVKPLTLSASRGVLRADSPAEAAAAAQRVREVLRGAAADPAGPLLVERYLPGAEVAVEGLLREGRLEVLAVFDKPDPMEGPTFEETLLVTPSRLPAAALEEVERTAAAAAAALGLREGPVHAELRVHEDRAAVLELAARSIGGLCSRTLRFGLGVSLESLILRHAVGLPLDGLRREGAAAGVLMLPVPRAGVLREVRGLEAARAVAGIAGVEISIPAGREVRPLPEADRYLGFVFARAAAPAEVERALRAAWAEIAPDVEPAGAAAMASA